MKKILITGGKGFIGSHLIDAFIERGYDVYSLDNSLGGFGNKLLNPKAHEICGDVRRIEDVSFALTGMDYCIHLAAMSHVKTCRENSKLAYDINVSGTINILEKCKNIKRVVVAASDHIYGKNPILPITENNSLNALFESDIYGQTKAMQAIIAQIYYKQYGLPIVITASGNVFSERQSPPNVIPTFINAALNNQPLMIHGNGLQTRDMYHISNLVDAYIKCIETPGIEGHIFNIGSGEELSVLYIARKVLELIPESTSEIVFVDNKKDNSMDRIQIDISKAKKMLNFGIITTFDEGLLDTIKNWKKL